MSEPYELTVVVELRTRLGALLKSWDYPVQIEGLPPVAPGVTMPCALSVMFGETGYQLEIDLPLDQSGETVTLAFEVAPDQVTEVWDFERDGEGRIERAVSARYRLSA